MNLPSITNFLLNEGLYKKFNLTYEDYSWLNKLINKSLQVDAYCPYCNKMSTFQTSDRKKVGLKGNPSGIDKKAPSKKSKYKDLLFENKEFTRIFECARNKKHIMTFNFIILNKEENDEILKTGQYPSLADIKKTNSDRYYKIISKLLSKEKASEFNDAIILHTNNYPIGAFVYLRRIFESLIIKTYSDNEANISVSKKIFMKNKSMKEKITILKDYLPKFIVNNKHYYQILSKGIHQLTKKECSEIFEVVRKSIEIILDDIHKMNKEKKKKKNIEKELNKINMKLK